MPLKFGQNGAHDFARRIARRQLVIRPRDMIEEGCPHTWLYHLQWFELEKVGPGLFIERGAPIDPLVIVARKYPRLTLGVTTALWAHDVIAYPNLDWWIMGIKDRVPKLPCADARYLRSSWPHEDRTEIIFQGTKIAAHTPLRAVLDCVRFRKQLGISVVTALLGLVLKGRVVERAALEQRAKELHVHGPLVEMLARIDRSR